MILMVLSLGAIDCKSKSNAPSAARPSQAANAAGSRWIQLPGGTFQMGDDYPGGTPVHSVTVPAFSMTRTETTVAEYATCVSAGKCTKPGTGERCNWGVAKRNDHPVNCVDWNQAVAFCRWAGGRLPSEAEWEWAARGGGNRTYPWGNQEPTCSRTVMKDGGPGCGELRTWPVCSKPEGNSVHGLCDLAGNVYEWVQDTYHPSYDGAPKDGSAWEQGGENRVYRGGCWSSTDRRLRAARRMMEAYSTEHGALHGFRCARAH